MKLKNFTPKDNKIMTEKYRIERGGICGQSCLAVIENSTIKNVLTNWKNFGLEWKGYSGWKQLKTYCEKKGYKVSLKRWIGLKAIKSKNIFYILRVQWIGEKENVSKPFYGWGHWTEASAHTHFIIAHNNKFFCNETGWFDDLEYYVQENNGLITSVMEIEKCAN